VPTGNFGDIYAGYLARCMGLPVERLLIATNQNDVLHRLMSTQVYARQPLLPSLSPSMDISVSSNFERLMFDLYERDASAVAALMQRFDEGDIRLSDQAMQAARALFMSARVGDEQTREQIRATWEQCGYLFDPHSAIGFRAAAQVELPPGVPMVTLATAHPAKFPAAVEAAGVSTRATLPAHLADLYTREERFSVLPNELGAVQAFMASSLRG
jgi:threonine synthase